MLSQEVILVTIHNCKRAPSSDHPMLNFRRLTRTLDTLLSIFYIQGHTKRLAPLPAQISMLYHGNLNGASRFIEQLKPMEYMAWKSLPKSTLRNLVDQCLFSAYCRQPGKYIPSFLMVNAGCTTTSTHNFRPLLHWTKVHSSVMSFIAALGRIISLTRL